MPPSTLSTCPSLAIHALSHSSKVAAAAVGSFVPDLPGPQLCLCAGDRLTLFSTQHQGLEHAASIPLFAVFDNLHAVPSLSTNSCDLLLLLSSHTARAVLVRLAVVQSVSGPIETCLQGNHKEQPPILITCLELAWTHLHSPCYQPAAKRPSGLCSSRLHVAHHHAGQQLECYLAVALYMDHIHVLRICTQQQQQQQQHYKLDCTLADMTQLTEGGSRQQQQELGQHAHLQHVLSLALLPCEEKLGKSQGSLLLGMLLQVSGAGFNTVRLETAEIIWGPAGKAATTTQQQPGDSMQAVWPVKLGSGPYSCRQLAASTRVLHALPATGSLPAGFLAISSSSALLISGPNSSSTLPALWQQLKRGWLGEGLMPQQVVLQYNMPGHPTCCEVLTCDVGSSTAPDRSILLLVGDSMAGLHLLRLAGGKACLYTQLKVSGGPLAPASILRYIPNIRLQHDNTHLMSEVAQTAHGLVYVGSELYNSQLLAVASTPLPGCSQQQVVQAVDSAGTGSYTASTSLAQQAGVSLVLADAALVKSLAPVHCSILVPDNQAADEQCLLLGCGAAPWGRLARAKLGAALCPYFPSTTTLPAEGAQLFPLVSRTRDNKIATSHLLFSFAATARTEVLCMEGDMFRQVTLPGMAMDSVTLHACTLPVDEGSLTLQVVPQGLRVMSALPEAQLLSTWHPPAGSSSSSSSSSAIQHIVIAASQGCVVAVCTASHMYSLHVTAQPLAVQVLSSTATVDPVSSLSVVRGPCRAAAQHSSHFIVWGNWLHSQCVVSLAEDLNQKVLQLDLHGQTARSACLMPLPTPDWLLAVGTNSGSVLLWQLHQPAPQGDSWHVSQPHCVQVSNIAVHVSLVSAGLQPAVDDVHNSRHWQAGTGPYIYAHSGQAAVIHVSSAALYHLNQQQQQQPGSPAQPIPLNTLLAVCGVHGSSWLHAACPLHAVPGLPQGPHTWAWVTASNQLMFGKLDLSQQIRWSTALIGDTPHVIAYHACSRCYVILTEDTAGQQILRLVHAQSLQPLLSMKLAANHRYTSLLVANLPCSSQQQGASSTPVTSSSRLVDQHTSAPPAQKEFVVLASHVMMEQQRPADGSSSAPAAHPSPAMHQVHGLLSFFEVVVQRAAAELPATTSATSAGSAAAAHHVHYKLLLHGVAPLKARVPLSLATAIPACSPSSEAAIATEKQQASGGAGAQDKLAAAAHSSDITLASTQPHLVVGCQDGVCVFRVLIDDAGSQQQSDVAAVLAAAASLPPTTPWTPPPPGLLVQTPWRALSGNASVGDRDSDAAEDEDEDEELVEALMEQYERMRRLGMDGLDDDGQAAALPAAGGHRDQAVQHMQALLRRDWSQHVMLHQVCSGSTLAGNAATALHTLGGLVLASDLLGSVTLFQLQQWHKPASSSRADSSQPQHQPSQQQGTAGVMLQVVAADHTPVYAQAAMLVDEAHVLLSVHPLGMALKQRDAAGEAAAARQQAAAESGAGQARRHSSEADEPHHHHDGSRRRQRRHDAMQAAAGLDDVAACVVRHPILHLLPGQLGLQLQQGDGPPSHTQPARSYQAATATVTAVASDGAVLGVHLSAPFPRAGGHEASAHDPLAVLLQFQQDVQRKQAQLQIGLASMLHADTWPLCVPGEAGLSSLTAAGGPGIGNTSSRQLPSTGALEMHLLQAAIEHGMPLSIQQASALAEVHAALSTQQ